MKKLYTFRDVEKLLGIKAFFVQRAINEELVKAENSAEGIRFTKDEINLWKTKSPELADRIRKKKEKFPIRKKDYKSKNSYILPFHGVWLVCGTHLNHCTRYAWDFIVIEESDFDKCSVGMRDEEIFRLNMKKNGSHNPRNFLCYGREIISPANGRVLYAPDPANFKSRFFDDQSHIIMDHGNGEIGRLCHILGRSVKVRKGDIVEQGQLICLAGGKHGDGVRRVPHLHWDIWDNQHFLFAKGLPVKISKARTFNKNKNELRYSFFLRKGMLVANKYDHKNND